MPHVSRNVSDRKMSEVGVAGDAGASGAEVTTAVPATAGLSSWAQAVTSARVANAAARPPMVHDKVIFMEYLLG
jgi:hypothetical protein